MCKAGFQLDYAEGVALAFSGTFVLQTSNHPGREEDLKNTLGEFLLASLAREQIAFLCGASSV